MINLNTAPAERRYDMEGGGAARVGVRQERVSVRLDAHWKESPSRPRALPS